MLTTGSSTVWIGGQNGFGSDGVIGVVALGVAALGRPDAHLEISEVGVLP